MNKYSSAIIILLSILASTSAHATCPGFHTLSNGTTADATYVMDNFNYLLQCPNFTGNVGIGTATPSLFRPGAQNLVVAGADTDTGISIITGGATRKAMIAFGYDPSTSDGGVSNRGKIWYDMNVGTLNFQADAGFVAYPNMTIGLSGNVGIGTVSPSYTLHVNGSVAGTSAYNNLSDMRLKKIEPIINALDTVEKLHGVRFAWRTSQERNVGKTLDLPNNTPQIGFIAQDVAAVLPEAVTVAEGKDAIMSMQESKIVPLLVEAIKEFRAEQAVALSKLQREISELRSRRDVTSNEEVRYQEQQREIQRLKEVSASDAAQIETLRTNSILQMAALSDEVQEIRRKLGIQTATK